VLAAAAALTLTLAASVAVAAAPRSDPPTTTVMTVTPGVHAFGVASTASVLVRDQNNHAPAGSVYFSVDRQLFAVVTLSGDGRAHASIPLKTQIGRHPVTANFVPAAGSGRAGSSGAQAIDVTKAIPKISVRIPYQPIYAGIAEFDISASGSAPVTGTVAVSLGGRLVAKLGITPNKAVVMRFKSSWPAGTNRFVITYSGDAKNAATTANADVTTAKAPVSMTLSAPATLSSTTGETATVRVTGAGAPLAGTVTLSVDGQATSAMALGGGTAVLNIPGVAGNNHTLQAVYSGDANHVAASRSASLNGVNPCAVTARVCVDLTNNVTWLQSGGQVTYGPVAMSSGRPGFRTEAGTFAVYWLDIDHHSTEFNNAPMPYSVFFDDGEAFHVGNVNVASHGCVHLSPTDAQNYFYSLHVGDQVNVFGYAQY